MTDHVKGALFLLSAAICWGPMAVAGSRSLIAVTVIWFYVRRQRIVWSKQLLLGALAYAGTVAMFVAATKMTTAANAILLQYTAPIYVALLGPWLLKEHTTRADWITIVVVFAGMGLFFMDQLTTAGMIGNILAIISGVFFALCVISLRIGRNTSSMHMVLLGNIITAIVCLPIGSYGGITVQDTALLVLLGTVQLGLGYILFVKGIRHVPAIEAALIPVIEPILNPLWVILFYGERPTMFALLGGVVVLTAVTARGVWKAKVRRKGQVPTPHPAPESSQ